MSNPAAIDDPIAAQRLVLIGADGRTPISVRVGRPYAADGGFRCPVQIEGLEPRYADIAGETSLQALCLALRLVRDRLEDQLAKGKSLSYPADGGEEASIDEAQLAAIFGWP